MRMHKQYRLLTVTNRNGEIRWYISMDPEFIEPVKDAPIFGPIPHGSSGSGLPLGKIVTSGDEWNFAILDLGSVLNQIEKAIRKAGLRKVRSK